MHPEMMEKEHTPTGQNCCQRVPTWAFKRQHGKTEQTLLIPSGCFSCSFGDLIWAQMYVNLCIFVLKWKSLQHSPQPAREASCITTSTETVPYPKGNSQLWCCHARIDESDLYHLICMYGNQTSADYLWSLCASSCPGASSSVADYLADEDIFPFWTAQCPPLLTATKWRRHKYVPQKAKPPWVNVGEEGNCFKHFICMYSPNMPQSQ